MCRVICNKHIMLGTSLFFPDIKELNVEQGMYYFYHTLHSGGSRQNSDRGSTLQFWAWWAWLAWKLDLCNDVVKQKPMISIFRKLGSLKALEHEATIL